MVPGSMVMFRELSYSGTWPWAETAVTARARAVKAARILRDVYLDDKVDGGA
jgi:hypothetical protein